MANSLLPQRLKELQKVNNYTQDYVAEALGTTRQTYSHYETGRRKPSPETIYKLALLYNVSADDLLHLSIEFDEKVFYEAPGPSQSSDDLAAYLESFNNPQNQKNYQYHMLTFWMNLDSILRISFHMLRFHLWFTIAIRVATMMPKAKQN